MILHCKTQPDKKSFVFLEGKNWKAEVQNAVSAKPETIKDFYKKRAELKLGIPSIDDIVKDPARHGFKTQKQLEGKSKEYNVQSFIGKSGAERKDTLFKILKDYFQNTVGGMDEAQAEKEAYLSLHILAQGNVKVDYVRDDAFVLINDGKISIYRRLRTGLKYRFKDIPLREMKKRGAPAAAPAPAPARAPVSVPPAAPPAPAPASAPAAPEPPPAPDIPPPPPPAPAATPAAPAPASAPAPAPAPAAPPPPAPDTAPPAPKETPDAARIAALEAIGKLDVAPVTVQNSTNTDYDFQFTYEGQILAYGKCPPNSTSFSLIPSDNVDVGKSIDRTNTAEIRLEILNLWTYKFIEETLKTTLTMGRPNDTFRFVPASYDTFAIFDGDKNVHILLSINKNYPREVRFVAQNEPTVDIKMPGKKDELVKLLNKSLDRYNRLKRIDEQVETIKQKIPAGIRLQYETPTNGGNILSVVHVVNNKKLVCELVFYEDSEEILLEKQDGHARDLEQGTAEEIAAKITALVQPTAAPATPAVPAARPPEAPAATAGVDQLSAELSREANVKIKITNRNPNPLEINTIRARAPQMIASIRGALGANRALLDDPDMQLEIYIPPNPVVGNLIDSLAQEIANDLPKDLAQIKLNNAASALGITFTPLEDDIDPKKVISSILQIRAAFSQIDAALRTKAQNKGVKFKLKPSSLIGSTAGYDEPSNTISFQFTTDANDLKEVLEKIIKALP